MKRFDLRNHKKEFLPRMVELIQNEIANGENVIIMFEIGDFSPIQEVANCVKENNWTLMNSLKYNEVDWMVVIKKEAPQVENTEEEESSN